eukprot:TRINITY_DN14761_c0_g1_i2.p1 TRINITY_DN14761_c0_g1~~TRINITY_DN14761_c0_g1_i2.p1  ORF type:complete len:457 (+),score=116.98 TRINITY_DN14761_c0_g1_i2:145-1515(+)
MCIRDRACVTAGMGAECSQENSEEPSFGQSPPASFGGVCDQSSHCIIDHSSCLGFDIGGTLTKVVFVERDAAGPGYENYSPRPLRELIKGSRVYGASARRHKELEWLHAGSNTTMSFISFETAKMEQAVQLIREQNSGGDLIGPDAGVSSVFATGGGAHKYRELWSKQLGVDLVPKDELGTVVAGISFMVQNFPDETYTLAETSEGSWEHEKAVVPVEAMFPFLLCHIGSGVSIVKVSSPSEFVRVSGTALGGGTFYGLAKMLTDVDTFQDAMELSEAGDQTKVNLLVGDIYGGGDLEIGGKVLPEYLTASFFGKKQTRSPEGSPPEEQVQDSDVCQALCSMVAQNICQIAHLNAKLHAMPRIFFTGGFLRHNGLAMQRIVQQMGRWNESWNSLGAPNTSDEPVEPVFFKHEGFFGAVGSFVQTERERSHSLYEEPAGDFLQGEDEDSTRNHDFKC